MLRCKHCLLLFCLAVLSLMAPKVAAAELTIASREIYNYSRLPRAWVELGAWPDSIAQLQSLNRLSFKDDFSTCVFRAEYELNSTYKNIRQLTSDSSWATSGFTSGFKKFSTAADFLTATQTSIKGQLERFDFSFSLQRFDIQLGRQPISFGTSHFVSVIDVLTPFQPGYLDSSFKPGIDALRIRSTAGTTGEAELIFATAHDSSDNAVIGRFRNTFNGFDLELTAGKFRQRNFIASGFEGERRRYNLWGELALFERLDEEVCFGGFSQRVATSWIIGAERSTGHGWRHGIARMHQDFGSRSVGQLSAAADTLPFRQGWVHLGASDYLLFSTKREMNPLTTLNVNVIHSLIDGSNLIQPVINISTSNESDLAVFAWLNTGMQPVATLNSLQQRSEFGSFSNGLGLIYRIYFNN